MKILKNAQLFAKIGGGCVTALVCLTGVESASAAIGFSGNYTPANWTLINNSADGFVDTTNAPTSITLTGGNLVGPSFGGPAGTTDYTVTATNSETISYDWNYSSTDDPGFDDFLRLLNGSATFLADSSGQSGTDSFAVSPGDTFGFRIATDDNGFGAGVVNVSNFASASASVPFEFSPSLGLLLVGGLFGGTHFYRKYQAGKVVLK